jgi:hypothetical protein
VYWLKNTLESLDGYYDVTLQNFHVFAQLNGTVDAFSVNGAAMPSDSYSLFEYSPSANVTALLVPISNVGCNAVSLENRDYHRESC